MLATIAMIFTIANSLIFSNGCDDPAGNDPNAPDTLGAVDAASNVVSGCVAALPKSCSGTPPSYSKDIAPLFARTCLQCHSPGDVAQDRPLTTYPQIEKLETTVLVQVSDCLMPPADAGPDASLTPTERTEILQWFVCSSPNN